MRAAIRRTAVALLLLLTAQAAGALELSGDAVQGGLIFARAPAGSNATLDGETVPVAPDGRFVIGFGRDETGVRTLVVSPPGADPVTRRLEVAPREYRIERVDGLPPRTVTPDPEAAERIAEEARMVASARARRDPRTDFAAGFRWPAQGRISGVYGSQRVLNGEPRRPHFGLDIAAPTGTPVHAPAPGLVTLRHPDMYFSGGTLVIDHGLGLTSTFLHLSEVLVEAGTRVETGDLVGRIGATGRASGPHLDWRMNWLDRRVDPERLVAPGGNEPSP